MSIGLIARGKENTPEENIEEKLDEKIDRRKNRKIWGLSQHLL
jgi:hypothetical protein